MKADERIRLLLAFGEAVAEAAGIGIVGCFEVADCLVDHGPADLEARLPRCSECPDLGYGHRPLVDGRDRQITPAPRVVLAFFDALDCAGQTEPEGLGVDP